MPRGPFLQKRIVRKSPTTTGGEPIRVWNITIINFFPGKFLRAIRVPRGIPETRERKVAKRETRRERNIIWKTS
jgi:hypothetical protein